MGVGVSQEQLNSKHVPESMFDDMEMWIDKETWMPLKMDMKDARLFIIFRNGLKNHREHRGTQT